MEISRMAVALVKAKTRSSSYLSKKVRKCKNQFESYELVLNYLNSHKRFKAIFTKSGYSVNSLINRLKGHK